MIKKTNFTMGNKMILHSRHLLSFVLFGLRPVPLHNGTRTNR